MIKETKLDDLEKVSDIRKLVVKNIVTAVSVLCWRGSRLLAETVSVMILC